MDKDMNRLKVVLAEKKRTNRWLAEQLGKDQATISKWCTNTSQPGLETLYQIAKLLGIEVQELLQPVEKVLGKASLKTHNEKVEI
ncbi:helix-turn-helix transcriptional regulator [Prevotella sp. P4-119]|uniref:helix-turn-helix transcriptional regulator n=1 Tax=Prevotella sp. P4-119 TaxID=2024218 RepID=UPI000B9735EC|nr:helix-turn-helix transcriptional regulator [Prevotella sp. P4-119]OYP46564.1 transcriptional regulator [Prevotella sp. P4-119]